MGVKLFFFCRNVIHGSDSVDSAQREISLWFEHHELFCWEECSQHWIYAWKPSCNTHALIVTYSFCSFICIWYLLLTEWRLLWSSHRVTKITKEQVAYVDKVWISEIQLLVKLFLNVTIFCFSHAVMNICKVFFANMFNLCRYSLHYQSLVGW